MTEPNDATTTEESSVSTDAELADSGPTNAESATDSGPTNAESAADSGPTNAESTHSTDSGDDGLAQWETLYKGALALFVLLAVIATAQLYASVGATINTFVATEYRPLFRIAFNLVVLLTAGVGISWTVRKLSGE
ncbi:hypothetical protein [Halorussus amylolyticus]|uniref:hypothetical protein n=1 Tax=Halorussus amylolyticus TaxID=1126242 RepID=UPI00138EF3EE|nr:hypothetical protein [Halorussus amylolyticus]